MGAHTRRQQWSPLTQSARRLGTLCGMALCCSVGLTPAVARDLSHNEVLFLREKGEILPLDTLVQEAQRRYPHARLLEAEVERKDGRFHYEIELLTREGHVRELEFDARSGQLLRDKEDD